MKSVYDRSAKISHNLVKLPCVRKLQIACHLNILQPFPIFKQAFPLKVTKLWKGR